MIDGGLWGYLRALMRDRWHAQRHEDGSSSGVPDVSYALRGVDGWLELKYLPSWPKRPETMVRIRGFTAAQLRWLEQRGEEGGGRCFVLLKVGMGCSAEYLLFRWSEAGMLRDGATRGAMVERCVGYWSGRIDPSGLADRLT